MAHNSATLSTSSCVFIAFEGNMDKGVSMPLTLVNNCIRVDLLRATWLYVQGVSAVSCAHVTTNKNRDA
ncbi:hypothetical protein E4U14_007018 [Claviceps sp. LM454 group G7]|nr:hypothetical protein E4U14_007018 [Claviceps sp. LM454 group G7]